MKALTLTQPWASLVALGVKRVETRSWSTSYRGSLAIHAAVRAPELRGAIRLKLREKGIDYEGIRGGMDWFQRFEDTDGVALARPLPLGSVVALCQLVDVIRTERVHQPGRPDWDGPQVHTWADGDVTLGWTELAFGDYSPGRYAWILRDVQPLRISIEVRGSLGLWEWKPEVDENHCDACWEAWINSDPSPHVVREPIAEASS